MEGKVTEHRIVPMQVGDEFELRKGLIETASRKIDKLTIELVPEDALMEWSNRGREGKPKRILDLRYDKK